MRLKKRFELLRLRQYLVASQREHVSASLGAVSIERQVVQRNGYAYASDEVFKRSHGKEVWNTIAKCRLAEIVRMSAYTAALARRV